MGLGASSEACDLSQVGRQGGLVPKAGTASTREKDKTRAYGLFLPAVGQVLRRIVVTVAFPLIVLTIWEYGANTGAFSAIVLPAPQAVVADFVSQVQTGQLQTDLLSSLYSVVVGFLVGAAFGLVLGTVAGLFPDFYRFFGLVFDGARQVPPIAWFPFIILWFGIGDLSKIVLVAFGTFFPVLINTVDGVRNTDTSYQDLVKLYKVHPIDVLTKVYIPSALPFLLTGLKLGASRAWMSVVAAEMLGAMNGLGYRIASSQQLMRSDVMLVDVLVVGVLGWALNCLLERVTARATRWKAD